MFILKIADTQELEEALEIYSEQLGEIIAQHQSETAAYGDSWPGAAIEIQELKELVAKIKDTIENYYP